MRFRRCTTLFLEPREEVALSVHSLLRGGDGLQRKVSWIALAPHVQDEVALDVSHAQWIGALVPGHWYVAEEIEAERKIDLRRLLETGLLIGDPDRHGWSERDARFRNMYWHPLAGLLHGLTRWSGVDTVRNMLDTGTTTGRELREVLGAPPPEAIDRSSPDDAMVALPRLSPTAFDDLLARRTTCRNFNPARALPLGTFARVMQRVFGVQAEVKAAPDTVFLKKNVPSGGGLHPIEAYLIVQNVEGIAPGLYHYKPREHGLDRVTDPDASMSELVMQVVAQQHWFSDAHVLVVLSPRFARTFWKYRRHAKSYRVVAMEAGHLSQMLYLAATDDGLGAFITAAINEVEIERAFGLDPLCEGALAVCGFGWRGDVMETAELDPAGKVWS